ncbi:MAG: folate family ECF transporter S component [Candidatus Izemoplasmataceae bacterium]
MKQEESNIVKRLVLIGILTALASIIKVFFQTTTTPGFRVTFYELPIIIAGGLFGPLMGAISGLVTDIVYLVTFGYTISLMTLSSILWGIIAGLVIYKKHWSMKRLIMVVLIGSVLEFMINGTQLFIWQYTGDILQDLRVFLPQQPIRLIILVLKWPIQIILIKIVYERVIQTVY